MISGCPVNGVLITKDLRNEGKPSPLFQNSENTTTYIFKYDYKNTYRYYIKIFQLN